MEESSKIPVIAVVGPTASGKTALAVSLAESVGGEVVSCDSMQIYRGMDIASAKPTAREMRGVPHHLVGFLDPSENYSVARFVADANAAIDGIVSRGGVPVLAGGTGLYVSSVLDGVKFTENDSDPSLRAQLNSRAAESGGEALLAELAEFDPEYAASLHPNDIKRIVRGIELYRTAGITMTEQLARSREDGSRLDPCIIGIRYSDRSLLYDRIDRRVDAMLDAGLVEEARASFDSACDSTASQAIGHKELFEFFRGECSLDEAVESLKRETRRYAKRQLSWFNRDKRINWIEPDICGEKNILNIALGILENNGWHDIIR